MSLRFQDLPNLLPTCRSRDLGNRPTRGTPQQPSFKAALRFWCKLGWISLGGTAAHIAIMHAELVEKKRWISSRSFFHALSHCMILPGPEAQQLAIYIGWRLHGKRGGIVAGILFVLPSMFILLALSAVYARFGSLPWIAAIFNGLKPVVIALVIVALENIVRRAVRGPIQCWVAVATFVAMFFFQTSLLVVMLGAIVVGVAVTAVRPGFLHRSGKTSTEEHDEVDYIRNGSAARRPSLVLWPIAKLATVVLLLWLLPFALFYFFTGDFHFWCALVLFFTKTALVTIGGSYTVIPYVAQIAVFKFHWLTRLQMMDGFALAETTPGPLIIVVAFVGFLAGYNHFHGSLWMGALGLLATTFYTFLPCFFFVFAGAPLVEGTLENPIVGGVLELMTGVVVGAVLDLTLFLGKAVVFPSGVAGIKQLNLISLSSVILSLFLLRRFKLKMIHLILLGVGFGSIRYFVGS